MFGSGEVSLEESDREAKDGGEEGEGGGEGAGAGAADVVLERTTRQTGSMVKDGQGREEPGRGANKTQDVRVIYMPSPKIDGGRRQSAGCRKRDAG